MDISTALEQLLTPSTVVFQSSSYLAGKVNRKANKIDADRRRKQLPHYERKSRLTALREGEHQGAMSITPWELLHTLGRATVLAGHGSSRALAQHWSCLKYITSLQTNATGRMELSADGKDPRYHRKAVQAEDLGIAFALATALRIAYQRHPYHHFEIVDAEVALEAGWALRGPEVKARNNTRLRPDYFLVGIKDGEPVRVITVECKGSHGDVDTQHEQLAKAAAQVHAVVIGDASGGGVPPPSLLVATALAARGGIEARILDPEGDGELDIAGHGAPALNGPVEQLNEFPAIPFRTRDGGTNSRPGFYIPPERSEWFSRVLTKTAAAGLLAFAGDRAAARRLLTPRQQTRVGAAYEHPSTGVIQDTEITLGGLHFVGTDHVFRFGPQRIEAFSGISEDLHRLIGVNRDINGYESALPAVRNVWDTRTADAEEEWGGAIAMDADGAILGLRAVGTGHQALR
jgi:hypothetical protein